MVFKYTAKITLSMEGDYVLEIPAIRGIRIKSASFNEVIQRGEIELRRYIEEQLRYGEGIPEDVPEISIKTGEISEVVVLKLVVFVDESGFIRA